MRSVSPRNLPRGVTLVPMVPEIDSLTDDPKQPRHIAIIMDGNGRWAERRRLPRYAGHRRGADVVRDVVESCGRRGVEVLTLFAFSSENWRRPREEVGMLMNLFLNALERQARRLHENNVRLRVIGERGPFSPELQQRIAEAEQLTASNSGLKLMVAANYGGRWDILQAARCLAGQVEEGRLGAAEITQERFEACLSLAGLPEPDLFIRTGGEQRISNFLLWQLAYTELYFTEALWPEFDEAQLEHAIQAYATRQRRYGRTGQQVAGAANAG